MSYKENYLTWPLDVETMQNSVISLSLRKVRIVSWRSRIDSQSVSSFRTTNGFIASKRAKIIIISLIIEYEKFFLQFLKLHFYKTITRVLINETDLFFLNGGIRNCKRTIVITKVEITMHKKKLKIRKLKTNSFKG